MNADGKKMEKKRLVDNRKECEMNQKQSIVEIKSHLHEYSFVVKIRKTEID